MIKTNIDNWAYDDELTQDERNGKKCLAIFLSMKAEAEHKQRMFDLYNACPKCHMIRCEYDIRNNSCENCGM